jgi:hypothetical protein
MNATVSISIRAALCVLALFVSIVVLALALVSIPGMSGADEVTGLVGWNTLTLTRVSAGLALRANTSTATISGCA